MQTEFHFRNSPWVNYAPLYPIAVKRIWECFSQNVVGTHDIRLNQNPHKFPSEERHSCKRPGEASFLILGIFPFLLIPSN
jgi:hypothetical protein